MGVLYSGHQLIMHECANLFTVFFCDKNQLRWMDGRRMDRRREVGEGSDLEKERAHAISISVMNTIIYLLIIIKLSTAGALGFPVIIVTLTTIARCMIFHNGPYVLVII